MFVASLKLGPFKPRRNRTLVGDTHRDSLTAAQAALGNPDRSFGPIAHSEALWGRS